MEPDQAQALEEVTQATRDLEVTWLQDEIETARGELRRTLQDPEVQRTLSYVLEIERLRKEVGELESRGRRTQTGADAERGEDPLFTTPGEDLMFETPRGSKSSIDPREDPLFMTPRASLASMDSLSGSESPSSAATYSPSLARRSSLVTPSRPAQWLWSGEAALRENRENSARAPAGAPSVRDPSPEGRSPRLPFFHAPLAELAELELLPRNEELRARRPAAIRAQGFDSGQKPFPARHALRVDQRVNAERMLRVDSLLNSERMSAWRLHREVGDEVKLSPRLLEKGPDSYEELERRLSLALD